MPNRIIKESICSSDEINTLSPDEEVFFYRLIVNCDDYGRLDARPQIIRSKCFPLKIDKITDETISKWLINLNKANLIQLYLVNGKEYLQLVTWEKHQRIRAKVSKYPDPTADNILLTNDSELLTNDNISTTNDCHPLSNVSVIQSESNPNPNPKCEKIFSDTSLKLANKLKTLILQNNPKAKTPTVLTKWALAIDKMIRIDNRTEEEIDKIIEFSQKDIFWMAHILSAEELRDKYDKLYVRMKNNGNGNNGHNGNGHKQPSQPERFTHYKMAN